MQSKQGLDSSKNASLSVLNCQKT